MLYKLITVLILALSANLYSQNMIDSVKSKEQPPEYVGGKIELDKFIKQNINIPEKYKKDSSFKKCRVLVKFIIDETGKIINPQIAKGCFGFDQCDLEALKIISIMPQWIPAKKDNKPVKRSYSLPFDFNRE